MSFEPVVHEYQLHCRPEHCFQVYVGRIGKWWHPAYSANPDSLQTVIIEPGVDGRIYAIHDDIGEDIWGAIKVWEPPHRLEYISTLAQSPDHPSRITVQFTADGEGCTMRFEHGGWNDANMEHRAKFTEWPLILDRFAERANQDSGV